MSIAYRGRLGPKILWVDDIVPEMDHDSGEQHCATHPCSKHMYDAQR